MTVLRLAQSEYYYCNRVVIFYNDNYIQFSLSNYALDKPELWDQVNDTEVIELIEGAFRIYYEHFKSKGD